MAEVTTGLDDAVRHGVYRALEWLVFVKLPLEVLWWLSGVLFRARD